MALAKYTFLNELQLSNKVVGDEKEELRTTRGIITLTEANAKPKVVKEADDKITDLAQKQKGLGLKRTGTLGKVWLVRRTRDAQASELRVPIA